MVKKSITKGRPSLCSPPLEELLEFAHVGYWHTVIHHTVIHRAIGILSYTTEVSSFSPPCKHHLLFSGWSLVVVIGALE